MINNNDKKCITKIASKYQDKEVTKLDELKNLDKKVKKPALVFTYIFGIIGSLVLGFGMCVAMKVILADLMWIGIIVGIVGIIMVGLNYLLYKMILNGRRAKYAN